MDKKFIITFGGAFSNHIVATAAACKELGLQSIGIIRGEEPKYLSHTLRQALNYDMQLFFTSRENYKQKIIPEAVFEFTDIRDCYIINEGGYGQKGAEGAKEILNIQDNNSYTHIICGIGTGTTLAGLVLAALPHQKILGISVLKNNIALQNEINQILPPEKQNHFHLFHQFHFGGYAKYTPGLIQFMNEWYKNTSIPLDFVYTGKVFFAADHLIKNGFFQSQSKILIIHSGGLQGNLSLPKGTLIY